MWGTNLSFPREKLQTYCGLLYRGRGFRQDHVSASYTHFDVCLLSPVVEKVVCLFFNSFSAGIIPYVAVDFICSWEEVSSESS